jgi:hypothetical protein
VRVGGISMNRLMDTGMFSDRMARDFLVHPGPKSAHVDDRLRSRSTDGAFDNERWESGCWTCMAG